MPIRSNLMPLVRRRARSVALLGACALSLQACTTYVAAARSPSDVLAESPHSVRVTLNNERTLELGKPKLRNGFVVEVGRDSVRLADIRKIEVPKVERGRTIAFIAIVIAIPIILNSGRGSSQEPDPGPSPIVPVLLRWP